MTELFPKDYRHVPDEQKTDADWEIDERLSAFAQQAFNKHWLACSKYLDAKLGGRQTSGHLHMLCQGYALALLAQGMQLREASRSEAEAEGLQPGPAKQDAPNPCYSPTPVSEEVRK